VTITKEDTPATTTASATPARSEDDAVDRRRAGAEVDELLHEGFAKFATSGGLKLTVSFEITPKGGLPPHRVEETKHPCVNWAWMTTFRRVGDPEPRRRGAGRLRAASGDPPELPPERFAKLKRYPSRPL
jgi:hypothetical protein